MSRDITILGIESSCDETAAAVVANGRRVLSNEISSQIDIHTLYGGVVPEIASRKHTERVNQVIRAALRTAGKQLSDIDAIAVTYGPGLVGALLVGVSAAKGLAFGSGIPLIGVNHIEGHVCANYITDPKPETGISGGGTLMRSDVRAGTGMLVRSDAAAGAGMHVRSDAGVGAGIVGAHMGEGTTAAADRPVCTSAGRAAIWEPPFICLIVSGGHTHLVKVRDYGEYEILGRTMDDAAGEAFDKVARAVGLGYPGGPKIDRAAREGDPDAIHFPRGKVSDSAYDFSFSGLKSAVLNYLNSEKMAGRKVNVPDVAASFQASVVEVLVEHAMRAVDEARGQSSYRFALAGGVASNSALRTAAEAACRERGVAFHCPPPILCTDNAAMIASAGYFEYIRGNFAGFDLNAVPNLKLGGS